MFNNRIFNVNGRGEGALLKTLEAASMQSGHVLITSYTLNAGKGLVLHWNKAEGQALPYPLTCSEMLPTILKFLEDPPEGMEYVDTDSNADHDGHNSRGWRVYCGPWGSVGDLNYCIAAIRPVFLWHGK